MERLELALNLAWVLVAGVLGARVALRLARGVRATTIAPAEVPVPAGSVTVIVPVLDEAHRIAPCLRGLVQSGPEVGEILVVDGGSRDGTPELVRDLAGADARVRVVSAAPVPAGWNGKAWGLATGLRLAAPRSPWIATIDADVRPRRELFAALVAHAEGRRVDALSVATRQELADPWQAVLHPALLATLVYRFGVPGREATRVAAVQANGQCFLAKRELLVARDAFAAARRSRCEDVTVARALVAAGHPVGFYEAGDLVHVRMHESWRETWTGWPRSLMLADRFAPCRGWCAWVEAFTVQALPLPIALALALAGATASPAFVLALVLVCMRLGVLAGARRAYVRPPATYWLAPLADLPALLRVAAFALRRRVTWRGRVLVAEGDG